MVNFRSEARTFGWVSNIRKALTLLGIGYLLTLSLYVLFLPFSEELRQLLTLCAGPIVFMQLHLVYLSRTNLPVARALPEVMRVGILWALLILVVDSILFVFLVPILFDGGINWSFFQVQPAFYWLHLPMVVASGWVARFTYARIAELRSAYERRAERLIYQD